MRIPQDPKRPYLALIGQGSSTLGHVKPCETCPGAAGLNISQGAPSPAAVNSMSAANAYLNMLFGKSRPFVVLAERADFENYHAFGVSLHVPARFRILVSEGFFAYC